MTASFESKKQHKEHRISKADSPSAIAYPSRTIVHAKLEMTSPGDRDEQEADEMADSIVNGEKIARSVSTGHSGSGIALSSQFGSHLASLQGQGGRLYGDLKSQMESGFGRDFSDVRLHTDESASVMSSSISAKAFTYGNDIFFNRGQFNPDTTEGQRLVAHELTHVVQGTGKLGREEDIEIQQARENLNDSFIHREDETITDNRIRTRDVIFRRDGHYSTYQQDQYINNQGRNIRRRIIDCEVFALELISYLERNNNGIRTALAKTYPNQWNYRISFDGNNNVSKVTVWLVSVDGTETPRIEIPREVFDPDDSTEIKKGTETYSQLVEEIKAFGVAFLDKAKTSPILIGDNRYYPIQFVDPTGMFQRHTALLFKRNNVWYLNNNNKIEQLENLPTAEESADEEVPRQIINQAIQQTLDIPGMPNYMEVYFNNDKYLG